MFSACSGAKNCPKILYMEDDGNVVELTFPLTDAIPAAQTLVVRDVDIVGVGALRRRRLEKLRATKTFIFRTVSLQIPDSVHRIYESELMNTLQWLRPLRVDIGDKFDLREEHHKTFVRVFPRTSAHLGLMTRRVQDLYLDDMEWSSWLLQDHWRYFVGFLRQQFPENTVLQDLAHWEWVQAWLDVLPFQNMLSEKNVIIENPSLQIVAIHTENPALKRHEGLYSFIYNSKKEVVSERPLDVYEAYLLDLLREDRKYSKKQLIEIVILNTTLKPKLSSSDWENRFSSLVNDGILLCDGEGVV